MTISAAKRLRVYKKSDYRCVRCGKAKDLTIDHIIPRALGGSDHEDNLQAMCAKCNSKKGASAQIPSKRVARRRWFAALESEQQRRKESK